MGMKIFFPGDKKVYADNNGFIIQTDQPASAGGEGSAPAPFDLFLASIGTCAGIYVKYFCDTRSIDTTGITIEQNIKWDAIKQQIGLITLDIKVPADFPEKYYPALIKAADQCAVKKAIQNQPDFEVKVSAE